MGMGKAMIVAGIGCRKGASAQEIDAAIDAALKQARIAPSELDAMATSDGKGSEVGIIESAAGRGVKLVLVRPADLEEAGARAESHSPRVQAMFNVPSVAEAAALSAAGPESKLLVPRLSMGPATCAIAATGKTP